MTLPSGNGGNGGFSFGTERQGRRRRHRRIARPQRERRIEGLATAATDLASLGSTLDTANTAAAAQTTGVLVAAEDEVSAAIAALFSAHGQSYQALSAQAAAFHDRFVQALASGAGAYSAAEAANSSPLQALIDAINAPIQSLTGRPLIGNGANGVPGSGGRRDFVR
jgi:PE family